MAEPNRIFHHRDPVVGADLHAWTFTYGGGLPQHGIQFDVIKTAANAACSIRLPAEQAKNLARAILATYGEVDQARESAVAKGAPDQLLTPGEVAALFGVDPKTVARWAQSGRLRAVRTAGRHRRYRVADVNAMAKRAHR